MAQGLGIRARARAQKHHWINLHVMQTERSAENRLKRTEKSYIAARKAARFESCSGATVSPWTQGPKEKQLSYSWTLEP